MNRWEEIVKKLIFFDTFQANSDGVEKRQERCNFLSFLLGMWDINETGEGNSRKFNINCLVCQYL